MRLRPLSLRGHLVALVLGALVPMLVLGGTLIGWLAAEQRESVEQGLLESAKALTLAVDREIDANLAALQGLAAADPLGDGNVQAFYDRMQLALRQHPYWANIALLDASGQQMLHTAKPIGAPLPNVANFDFVRQAMETGKPTVSDLITGPVAGRLNIAILFPVLRDGQLTHILAAVVNPEAWSALLAEFSTEPGTVIAASDRQHRIIARNRDAEAYLGREGPAWAQEFLDQAASGVARGTALQGHDVVSAHQKSARTGWTLIVARPSAETDAPVKRTLGFAVALGAILLLLSLAVAAAVARRIARPVTALAVAGRELADLKPIAAPSGAMPTEIDRLWRDLTGASGKLLAATRAAQHADARHRSIVDTAMDAIVVTDAEGRIALFNKAAERIFGYIADEVMNHDVSVLMPEPYRSEHGGLIARYRTAGGSRALGLIRTFRGQRKDGATFPLEVSLAEWRVDGQVFFTAILRDITARVEAERELRESHALLKAIIDGVPDPIFVKDLHGRHVVVNAAVADVFNQPPDAVLGETDAAFLPPEIAERIQGVDRHVMDTGQTIVVEEEVVNRAGFHRYYLSTKAPLYGEQGQIRGVIGVARDITERRRFEDDLRHAKTAAERANLAKSKFLAAVSHDLRQPSQSLYLFLAAVRARLGQQHPVMDLLDTMQRALDAQKALLDSLVDISRLDAGRVVPQPVPVPMGPLLERLGMEYGLRAEAKGLTCRTVTTRMVVRSDPALLEQMLRNLLENALRYTHHGHVLVGCRRRGDRVRIAVLDTGIGIPPSEREVIWEEFYQVGNPERDRAKGLGLGLSIVRRLGRLLGHPVDMQSVPGRGSCFFIEAERITQPTAAAVPQMTAVANDDIRGLIIVIDDEALVRLGFQAMLEGWGYEVLTAGSADEALALLRRHGACPNLIVADYRLRENRTGTEAIRDIHEHCGVEIPALVVTGDTAPERIAEAEGAGFALLHKPVGAAELRQHVRRVMQRQAIG